MKKRWLLLGSAAVLSIGLLAGCSGGEADSEGFEQDAPATTEPTVPNLPTDPGASGPDGSGSSGETLDSSASGM